MIRIGSVVGTLSAILAAGCLRADQGTRADTGRGDSDTLDLRRPALVAYFFKSQHDIDTSESLGSVVDDMHALANDRKDLESHGVEVRDVYADTLRVRWPDGRVGFYHIASSDSDFCRVSTLSARQSDPRPHLGSHRHRSVGCGETIFRIEGAVASLAATLSPGGATGPTSNACSAAALAIGLLLAALFWWRNGDRLAAAVCRARYAAAKSVADSAAIDDSPSGIEHRGYVPASCGLLRRTGGW